MRDMIDDETLGLVGMENVDPTAQLEGLKVEDDKS